MPDISMTDFVDFVIRAGTPKLTKVREIKTRRDYSPAMDFWKPLRDALREFHRTGKPLERSLSVVSDPKKLRRYPDATLSYEKFVRGKQIEWFEPPSNSWTWQDLRVRVNPELGLRINSRSHAVKLYFKDEPLTQRRLAVIFQMMKQALLPTSGPPVTVAVLDISKGKFIPLDPNAPDITPLLIGEAAAFLAIWNAISTSQ